MSCTTRWRDVRGRFSAEITPELLEDCSGYVRSILERYLGDPSYELVIDWSSTGYDAPATHMEPPEHSDERHLVEAYIDVDDELYITLVLAEQEALFDHFADAIQDEPLPGDRNDLHM